MRTARAKIYLSFLLFAVLSFVFTVPAYALTDRTPPTAPGNVNVSSVTYSSVRLSWSKSKDNVGVYSYKIYRNGKYIGSTRSASITLRSLRANTNYSFYIKAADRRGNVSSASAVVRAKTAIRDTKAPSKPPGLSFYPVSASSITLAWKPSSDNVKVASYIIYRNSVKIAETSALSYTVKGLVTNRTYSFYVKARDTSKNISAASAKLNAKAIKDVQPPSAPAGLKASAITAASISLEWQRSNDNVGVASYLIYKDAVYIGSATSLSYTVSGLNAGSAYQFYVVAKDPAGNCSSSSNTLQAITAVPDTQPPEAPQNLSASTVKPSSAALYWDAAVDNIQTVNYLIYKDGVKIGQTDTPYYTATGLQSDSAYAFTVIAQDAAGNLSAESSSIQIKTPDIPSPGGIINGYYASWAAYSGYTPLDIPAAKLTHISYAFANIDANNKIELGDPDIDPANFAKLRELKKQHPNIKTLISVGGWTWSGRFSDVAATAERRSAFADSVVAFILQYGFDGVDLDWEYPGGGGLASNVSRPEDKTNFTLLLAQLRQKLDAQGSRDGSEYLLTFAGGCGTSYAANTELKKLSDYVDFATMMTYDIHGAWKGSYTDFNAPLFTPSEPSSQYQWSADDAVKLWKSKGFPAYKIIMGIPFYGIRYNCANNANNGLYQGFANGSSISYDTVASCYLNNAAFARYEHPEAKVPWLFDGSTFISYDDAQSIAQKAAYIKDSGIGGAAIWELSQNTNGELLESIYSNIN